LEQKQKIIISILLLIAFLSVIVNEIKLWSLINFKNLYSVMDILIPILKLLAFFLCVRLFSKYNNPFFKFQGIALVVDMANKGVQELGDIYINIRFHNFEPLNPIAMDSISLISMILYLVVVLLALYGLFQYREGWELEEKVTLAYRFNYLVASARSKGLLWPVIIVALFLINMTFLISAMSMTSAVYIIIPIIICFIFTVGLIVKLPGFFLCLSFIRIYENNIFKYLAVIYIIPLVSMVISYLNSSLNVYRSYFSLPSFFRIIESVFDSIIAFQDITIAILLVIALSIYRAKENDIQT